ncbi:MAG: DUF1292 domain-containing protein [Syntrophomonadaceae bacterium]|nr:DUF1292 domain-containing protein [Syntrophomonadaceae bacterium]
MDDERFFEEELPIMVLVDEEGTEHQFELLAELEVEDSTYRVLTPFDESAYEDYDEDEDEDIETEIYFFKVIADDDGNEFLLDIDDDEEWEKVADAWQELADNYELDYDDDDEI